MLKVGIRAHDVSTTDISELVEKLKAYQFENLQFVLNKAIKGDDGFYNEEKAKFYHHKFASNKINITMLGAYFNPVHSDKTKVENGILKFKNHLQYANILESAFVGSETGSYNDDKWTFNPLNLTEEAYQTVLRIFKDLAQTAAYYQTNLAIEGAYGHVINTPKRLKRLIDDIACDNVFVTIDLFNFLSLENHHQKYQIFDEAINLLADKIVIFHLKDYIVQDNKLVTVGLGKGLIDFTLIIKKIWQKCPNATLIFEGVTKEDITTSKKMIDELIKKIEVENECE